MHRQPTEKDTCTLCQADAITVKGYKGIAFWPIGHPVEVMQEDENGIQDEWTQPQQIVAIMVGDNKRHTVDIDDATPIPRNDFCGECGQIGCNQDGLEREA